MEDLLNIPGVFERMVDSKLISPFSNSPLSKVAFGKDIPLEYWIAGAAFVLLCYHYRYEIGYYVFQKTNKKYPSITKSTPSSEQHLSI